LAGRLSSLGLDAGKYHTEISNLVFNLLDLDLNNDQLLSLYFECIDKASEIEDVEDQKKMQGMAEGIMSGWWRRRKIINCSHEAIPNTFIVRFDFLPAEQAR
jgi:hypothetical protein